ncbi:GGDEF domain-containing protein [Thermanaerovibrio velox DSM 12556]|uniref:GGDEF domain-containing protein n=1 Tax=Thermanaerovibrio velox DSM 12556 TaxID=926567 RepID=H0UPG2_9BACT|nr:GGDEF domain-containing protein [Thermanaerovibrio velox DSM 12556]
MWAVFLSSYLTATACYVMNSTGSSMGQFCCNLSAQGLLLAFVSPAAGASPVLAWLGVALASAGMVGLISCIQKAHNPLKKDLLEGPISISDLQTELKSMEDSIDITSKIPLPALWARDGTVESANREIKLLLGRDDIEGSGLNEIINPSLHELDLGGTGWLVFRKTVEGEDVVLLAPKGDVSAGDSSEFVDPKTGLYSDRYARKRGEEEIERARRYRRWLSMALLKLEFENLTSGPLPQSMMDEAYMKFIGLVKKTIRTTDMGFRLKDGCVLLLLPETPSSGARTLFGRIKTQVDKIIEEGSVTPFRINLLGGFSFYGGNGTTSYSQMLEEAYSNLALNED